LFLALLTQNSPAQEKYSKIKIYCTSEQLIQIGNLGIPTDHGKHKSGYWFETELSESEIEKIGNAGYGYDIIVDDVKAAFLAGSGASTIKGQTKATGCAGATNTTFDPITPDNFAYGSMGGYYTYQQMLDQLDSMLLHYPSLITARTGISTFLSWQGRPIWWVKISDNPSSDEPEHEVLYTSIHHAREPLSLTQNIYYMWWLLENYATNPEVQYLVDNTEMYFVPMINPDGYVYNQITDPGGGGMHRKNRNPAVGTTNKGVDLNRNYSYHWNETGTSPDENDDTYAGSSAFSEPETQAIKWFCENRDFEFAFNAHTYSNLLLFPIGWTDTEFATDHDYFMQYTAHMVVYNGYANEKSSDLYPASGDSDDYMYIDDPGVKPTIFAKTPEIGDSFWPVMSDIIPIAKEMVWPNKTLAHMPHVYGVLYNLESNYINDLAGYFSYDLERLGYQDGDMTVSITPLTGILTTGSSNTHTLLLGEIDTDSIDYTLDPTLVFGDEIKYILHTDNGLWVRNDTIIKMFGALNSVFYDDCSDMSNWTSGDWSFTGEDFYSAANCITDSPYDPDYDNGSFTEIELNEVFDLTDASYANVQFYAKWAIENNYDFVQFMASSDGGLSWTALCGNYTNPGTSDQILDDPLFDGFQTTWVKETIDLADYVGMGGIQFKFTLTTDIWSTEDGFYFDDFELLADAGSAGTGSEAMAQANVSIYPNPASDVLNIRVGDPAAIQTIEIVDEYGRHIVSVAPESNQVQLQTGNWAEGIYFVKVLSVDKPMAVKRVSIIR